MVAVAHTDHAGPGFSRLPDPPECRFPDHHVSEAPVPVQDQRGVGLADHLHLRPRDDLSGGDLVHVAQERKSAMRIVAREMGVDPQRSHGRGLGRRCTRGHQDALQDPAQSLRSKIRHQSLSGRVLRRADS